ncbi:MAG: hypothetical protein FJZ01_27810 [Candidatus Sericytochromatia bacterium]|nr:hypothetical protein [Candidatus Tanganyikabacteria bacterium]
MLVAPSLPENVGMAARAVLAFGGGDLVLVGGVSRLHPLALAAAAGAEPILAAARQVGTLAEALAGAELAVATTARGYDRPDLRVVPVRAAARLAAGRETAWVFGTEKHGLTVAELRACHQVARIPAPGPSLNLAQAVAICLYEAAQAEAGKEASATFASEPPPGAEPVARPARRPRLSGDAGTAGRDLAGWLIDLGVARARDASAKAHTLLRLASRLDADEHEQALLGAIIARLTTRR